jgi:hypothetical protein
MKGLLDRIERELMHGVRRRVDRRRARRRRLLLGAVALAVLALASAASAVSGIGPAAGLFHADEAIPRYREPEPGGRLAALHAGGEGAAGWDLLVYRSEPPRLGKAPVRPYCIALASRNKGLHGGSTECEHPLTKAARLMRKRMELGGNRGGAWTAAPERPLTAPFYGLVLGDAERVTITEEGRAPIEAELSRPFRLELPRLTRVQRGELNPRQRRMTASLPRSLEVRAFLAALEAPVVPVGQRIPVVAVTARFSEHGSLTRRTGGQLVRPQPKPMSPEERFGTPQVRLTDVGPDGRRWEAVGLTGRDGMISASATIAPWGYARGSLFGGSGAGWAKPLAERGIMMEVSRQLPGGRRSPGSHAIYGVARGDVRSIVFTARDVAAYRAKLSPVFATARGTRRRVNVRLFLAAVPGDISGRLRPQVRP